MLFVYQRADFSKIYHKGCLQYAVNKYLRGILAAAMKLVEQDIMTVTHQPAIKGLIRRNVMIHKEARQRKVPF